MKCLPVPACPCLPAGRGRQGQAGLPASRQVENWQKLGEAYFLIEDFLLGIDFRERKI